LVAISGLEPETEGYETSTHTCSTAIKVYCTLLGKVQKIV